MGPFCRIAVYFLSCFSELITRFLCEDYLNLSSLNFHI